MSLLDDRMLNGLDYIANTLIAPAIPLETASLRRKIFRTPAIRINIFYHIGAFDVAKLLHAFKLEEVVEAGEKAQFLSPLRDIFTTTEFRSLYDMIRRGDVVTIWGYELWRLFDRVRNVASYASNDDSRTRTHLWIGGGSLIPINLPGHWVHATLKNNVRLPLPYKKDTPDPLLSIGQVEWDFVSCDTNGSIEMGVKADMADLLLETMTGITRPRRTTPRDLFYINLSRGHMKSCRFSKSEDVSIGVGVSLRLSIYDSAFDHGEEDIIGSYKLRLRSRG